MALQYLRSGALCILALVFSASALPPVEPPLIPDHPFVVIWNAPTDRCQQLEIPLDTAAFQAVTTPANRPGQFLTLFYEDRLGLYPKVDTIKRKIYQGGIPQNGNLTEHLVKAEGQINRYISQDSSPGLAVIDWESWRPLWDQNWGSKRIYQKLSIAHALQIAPFLSLKHISKLAKMQFQQSGRSFMEKTISLGIGERPSRRWGFYLFPDCFNYGWDKANYTGKCSEKIQKQNNQLLWLWERSTALFPSIYLHKSLRNSPRAALFARNRVQEAVRVAALPKRPYTVPIYVYSRPLYRDQTQLFESQMDLISTIGESAALGASGVVMWGGTKDYNILVRVPQIHIQLRLRLTHAAHAHASRVLCQGKGRCVRKNYNSPSYLHLDSDKFRIIQSGKRYVAVGQPSADDLNAWAESFTCQCYAGGSCKPKLLPPTSIQVIRV
ncbi:hypothetical protein OJAV_G00052440 [Oryzias javanicus]|uniref:Hyaluronidase n=1 Tax=Oryzias javanicus TaxID=123683 RepID=A0A3S2PWA8_ORYJA|nr:hypothetical protein OJAV_G00052440 [Oryzias javanicus]